MSKLYINLPVADLQQSVNFYKSLGFEQNLEFSNEQASAMTYGSDFSVMLLAHEFFSGFLPANKIIADSHKTTEVLNALELDSRVAVDTFYNTAIRAGGKKTIDSYDHGFMYGRDFEDLDGHIWEVFWMDITQMPKA
jgi:predicted lactoylglutathione lyase